jgi:hypothetical protein
MQSRARVGYEIGVLDDEEVAGGIGGDDLKSERAETKGMEMARAVLAGGDGVEGRSGRCFGRALRENIMESHGGEEGRGGLEEGAAKDGHGGMIRQEIGISR